MIAQLTGLDQMSDCEERAKDDADSCYDDVGDAQEGILATDNGSGGDDDGFSSAVLSDVEFWCWLVVQNRKGLASLRWLIFSV